MATVRVTLTTPLPSLHIDMDTVPLVAIESLLR
jgi:hypothetical protein